MVVWGAGCVNVWLCLFAAVRRLQEAAVKAEEEKARAMEEAKKIEDARLYVLSPVVTFFRIGLVASLMNRSFSLW